LNNKRINSYIEVETYEDGFNEDNGISLCEKYDIIVDCSDNVETRYLINDAAILTGKPLVSGSAIRCEGQVISFNLFI
jgi:molybdopterin/thiamine biosynthesis adenylyltransferase